MNKLQKYSTLSIVVLAGVLMLGSVISTSADGATVSGSQPGSVDDPVVTKSYVDEQVQKLVVAELAKQTGGAGKNPDKNAESSELKVVTIKSGEKLIAKAGTEFIVRAGKAVVYSPDANGISDLTDGKDISNEQDVVNNHLLLFPRDGRGVMPDAKQKNGLTVMVRGGYDIK
ncbi:hypothetical protein ACFQZR_07770 [Paenibacillus sp. GCM10027629]|uniref:hypothetical protein n=1 Tax=Paenibacillus sp. GCM10027629 TaxID=3273414 RepID=UPI00362DB160